MALGAHDHLGVGVDQVLRGVAGVAGAVHVGDIVPDPHALVAGWPVAHARDTARRRRAVGVDSAIVWRVHAIVERGGTVVDYGAVFARDRNSDGGQLVVRV